jgi:arylsulfatase A-like enzyme
MTSQPQLVAKLLPGSAVALALGATFGILWSLQRRTFWAISILALSASIAPALVDLHVARTITCLPRAMFLLVLGAGMASWLASRWQLSAVRTGLVMGTIAAAVMAAYVGRLPCKASWVSPPLPFRVSLFSVIVVGAAAAGLAGGLLRQRTLRRVATAAAITIPAVYVMVAGDRAAQLRRRDQPNASVAAASRRPNLLMIILDTVRADHLAAYGHERNTMPGLEAFMQKRATRYTEARATGSWTLPSHASLFTGLFPSEHRADHPGTNGGKDYLCGQPLRPDVPTLAERLANHGYQTAAIVANSVYLAHQFKLDRGFAHYDDRSGAWLCSLLLVQLAGHLPEIGRSPFRNAESITNLALRWITDRPSDRPFFLFLNYVDAHVPYLPPRPYDAAFDGQQPRDPLAPEQALHALLYDRELLYLDEHVTRLLRELETRNLLDDTVVIVTSDHGEAFGEHELWTHDHTLYEELLRIPLFVKPVKPVHAEVSHDPVTLADVHDLALREVGLEADTPKRDGNLVAEWLLCTKIGKGWAVDVQRDLITWIDGNVKWIVSSKGQVEAYDLDSDPAEQRPLPVAADQVAEMRARARTWWDAHPPLAADVAPDVQPEISVQEQLRNLGYMQ